jgi:hypothetical protein
VMLQVVEKIYRSAGMQPPEWLRKLLESGS